MKKVLKIAGGIVCVVSVVFVAILAVMVATDDEEDFY